MARASHDGYQRGKQDDASVCGFKESNGIGIRHIHEGRKVIEGRGGGVSRCRYEPGTQQQHSPVLPRSSREEAKVIGRD